MSKFNISGIERSFVLKAISERKRLDGRDAFQYRDIAINFGLERGCCMVDLGRTKVMAQVSCEVATPKESRPTEGILFVNVELSSMAAPYFDSSRPSEASAEVNRLLERCLKDSGCVDLESLCIQAGMKVWVIRIDLHVLNNDGNMVDALCVAAITALSHFRRPDIIVCGEDTAVVSTEERDPLPLTLHHLPICVTFAIFDEGKYILIDPTELEEHVMDGTLVVCMNRHKEVCIIQSTGKASLLREQISRCKEICFINVCAISDKIVSVLQRGETDDPVNIALKSLEEEEEKPKKKKKKLKKEKPMVIQKLPEERKGEDSDDEVVMEDLPSWDSDVEEDLDLLTRAKNLISANEVQCQDNGENSISPKKTKKKKKKGKVEKLVM